jgi:hypothetical protein
MNILVLFFANHRKLIKKFLIVDEYIPKFSRLDMAAINRERKFISKPFRQKLSYMKFFSLVDIFDDLGNNRGVSLIFQKFLYDLHLRNL